jgi:AAA family ATP:ADP antiporter
MVVPGRPALAPAAVLFAFLAGHAVLETGRDALFLVRLGADRLASAYVVMAAIAVVATLALRRGRRFATARVRLVLFLAVATAGTAAMAAAVATAPWATFALYVWTGLVATLVVPTFWSVVDRQLALAQAKRAFATIAAGGSLGALVGSALAAGLSRWVAPHHLVTAGAAAFALAAVLAATVLAADAPALTAPPAQSPTAVDGARRYLYLLLVVGLLATVTLTIGDLTFKRVVGERFAPAEIAPVLGTAYTVLAVVALIVQVVVTPRLLARRSVGDALVVLPALVVVAAAGFAITGALIAIAGLKLADGGIRHSLHRVASEILYLPVPADVRDATRPAADAIAQRGGQALAAALVVGATAVVGDSRGLAALTAVLAVGWLAAITVTRRAYVARFRDMLRAGETRRDGRVPDLDGDAVSLLTASLASPDEVEAITALDLLDRGGAPVPPLVLYHPQRSVVRRALRVLEGDRRPEVARVLAHLHDHPDPQIRGGALAAASDHERPARLRTALRDVDREVRAVAAVALLADDEHHPEAGAELAALAAGRADDRAAAARAIGYAPGPRFAGHLHQLLGRGDEAPTREVLRVLARAPDLVDLDRLLPLLADPRLRGDVRTVFIAAGARGLAHLVAALDDPRVALPVRRHLPRTVSRFRSPPALRALQARLPREPDGITEFKILRALGRLRADDPSLPVDAAVLRGYARRAIADAARYATLADALAPAVSGDAAGGGDLLLELLAEKRRHGIEHAFRALAILRPRAGLRSIHDAVTGADPERRTAAREVLEGIAPAELRAPLLALVDELAADERRQRLGSLAAGPFSGHDELVAALLADPSESLRCVAAHHAAARGLTSLRPHLARLRPLTGPPLVRFAFDQALARLVGGEPRPDEAT